MEVFIMSSPLAFKPTLNVIAALAGNFYVESRCSAGMYEGQHVIPYNDMTNNNVYGGYGLGQWTNAPDLGITRRTELVNYLDLNQYARDSADGQLNFLISENFWIRHVGPYSSLITWLASDSTDISSLCYQYQRNWEVSTKATELRATRANMAYNYIDQHYDDSDITDWIIFNSYTNAEEYWRNNIVMLARWFWDDDPTPPSPPDPPTPIAVEDVLIPLLWRGRKRRRGWC